MEYPLPDDVAINMAIVHHVACCVDNSSNTCTSRHTHTLIHVPRACGAMWACYQQGGCCYHRLLHTIRWDIPT